MTNDEWARRSAIRHSEFVIQRRLHELHRQPIEQFRMRRRRALRAEIVFSLHNAASEILLPEAIDHHARGERVLWVNNPECEVKAVRERRNRILRRGISVRSGDGCWLALP